MAEAMEIHQMGEYANKDGRQIKLGTCENLFYVTRADIEALARDGWQGDGGMVDLRGYLKEPAFRVCLPHTHGSPGNFHDIDARKPDYPNALRIAVSPELIEALRGEADHGNLYHHAAGVNFIIPCPCGKGPHTLKTSPIFHYIELCAEGCGNGRAIYRCPFCKYMFNLAGHDRQLEVVAAFEQQWCFGPHALQRPTQEQLLAMMTWKPEPALA